MKTFLISLLIYIVSCETITDGSSPAPESAASLNETLVFSNDLCDLVTEAGICLFNGEKVLTSDAQPKGLIGHWSFDDAYVHNKNPPIKNLKRH